MGNVFWRLFLAGCPLSKYTILYNPWWLLSNYPDKQSALLKALVLTHLTVHR